ncbi:CidA/LrgA family protein [Anaerolentibacter hominis]|uniref:CidA/LrgA family protein n=1 Tax=Anaerolentibacter hominis TaxID=3079009 RepID=UPI0031B852EF
MISILKMGIIFLICLVGEIISYLLPFTFPSSVISMILLFILLVTGVLKPRVIREEANFLLQNMAFFYIPAGVAMIKYLDIIRENILILLLICLVSMVLTFAAAAYTVTLIMKFQEKWRAKRQ